MNIKTSLFNRLSLGLKQLAIDISPDRLLDYLAILQKWNHSYNLTAVRDPEVMIGRHLLDSLAILPWVKGERILDVGTGAGLPGIPLAIALPSVQVVLLDSNGKKIRFLQEVKRALALDNIEIVQARAESYNPTSYFDSVISRAFSELQQMLTWTEHLVSKEGIWLAMKGRTPDMELSSISYPYRIENYFVDGVEGQRCCIIIQRTVES
ncbi:MAG: 16S rRNA (guanine(527)-N(7))-methyltransferase RsmG [Legionella sp.]